MLGGAAFQGLTPSLCPLNMGTESVAETLEYLHTLTWLSAQEHFIEFCCHESFKTYVESNMVTTAVYYIPYYGHPKDKLTIYNEGRKISQHYRRMGH